jgi:hypothetical protein
VKPIWTNEGVWARIAVIVSLAWIFVWFLFFVAFVGTPELALGGVLILAAPIGIGLIITVCIGVPWIAYAVDKKPASDKKPNKAR